MAQTHARYVGDYRGRKVDCRAIGLAVSTAAFIPVGGIAAGRFGARNAFVAALCVFLAGSLSCALSPSLAALVAARAFQGLGGAAMMPISRQLVVREWQAWVEPVDAFHQGGIGNRTSNRGRSSFPY